MHYTNPIAGNHAMTTMATFIQLLPKGFATTSYRSTIEGKGRSVISPGPNAKIGIDRFNVSDQIESPIRNNVVPDTFPPRPARPEDYRE